MGTVYLLSPGQKMCRNGGRMEIWNNRHEKLYSLIASDINSVVVGGYTQISTEAIFTLLKNGVQITYVDKRGKILGCMSNERMSISRLIMQQERFADPVLTASLVRYVLRIKLKNQRNLLLYYASKLQKSDLKEAASIIKLYIHKLDTTELVEELRGYEGIASKVYFEAFGRIFDSRQWDWSGRNRRPPRDPVNSMLSYGYAFLEREVRTSIAGIRLDPRIGFLHSNNGRKDSLVYDMMEMFRQNVIDKFVLKIINKKILLPIDFRVEEEDGCNFCDAARHKWIGEYEKYMLEPRKILDGLSWRQYMHKEMEKFADLVIYGME